MVERNFFRSHFKSFRVTLSKNVKNSFWLVCSKGTFAKIIFPDFPFFPDFREFFQAFMASRVIFGNNDINHFWLSLWLGVIMAAAAAAAIVKFSAPVPASYCCHFCLISYVTPGLKEAFVSSCWIWFGFLSTLSKDLSKCCFPLMLTILNDAYIFMI